MKNLKPYPTWVCSDCARQAGGMFPDGHVATFHAGECDVCGEWTSITEPRDFGYPNFRGFVPSGVKHD